MDFGKWHVLRELGSGGQGTAYLTVDRTKLNLDSMIDRLRPVINGIQQVTQTDDYLARCHELLNIIDAYTNREASEHCAVVTKRSLI